ncbi:MAG TPA: ABC transporter permease [Chthoniobacterales bacterium]|nr:ABC transporter permease [Chthoniobacterales bacterium]
MPDFKSAIRATVANLQLSAEREAEILEELSQHLEERYEEALNHGASEQEAKQSALDELNDSLGHQLKSVERISRARVPPVGMQRTRNRFAGFWEDIRFGLRMLRKQPGFAIAAILTLGIGIGASTAMLSLVQDVLIRPLPYAHSDRLYAIWASSESSGQNRIAASGPDFLDYLEQNRSFAHLAEFIPHFTFTWTGDGEPKLVNCTSVTEEFFPMLGIRPYLGRLYEPREFTYLENDTLVVSYRFWKNQLGGDPNVIGRVVHFEGVTETIVGVLPPLSDLFPDTDVWPKHTIRPSWPYMQWRGNKFLSVIGELKPKVTPAMAEEDLTSILRRVPEEPRDVQVHLVPLKQDLVGNVRLPLYATLGAAALILLVACINVAALLLARAVKREGEIAVRLSLGAGLPRIAQQLVTEALLLCTAGCGVGLFVAWSVLRGLTRIPNLPLPRLEDVHLNAPALLAMVAIASAMTLLFGWIPSLAFSRLNLTSALRPRGQDISGRRGLSLAVLVSGEIACSIVLTVTVGLLVHSFWRVMQVDPGFESRSLLRVYLRTNYYDEKGRAFWKGVLAETSSLPGVSRAALSDWRPGRDAATATFVFEDRPSDPTRLPSGEGSWISADFFRSVGTQLITGRFFDEHDDENAPAVVIINKQAAQQFWPNQNPIGKRIGVNYTGPGRRNNEAPRLREIVGVVGDIHHDSLDAPAAPAVYMPYLQDETKHDMATMSLFVRGERNAMNLADGVRDRIHAVNPDQPVQNIQNVAEMMSDSVATRRYTLVLVGAFAGVGLLLAAVGVYGVISYAVSQRTREFGIRIALGATRGRVISHVLRRSVILTAIGSLVGVVAAIVLTRSLSSLLFEVNPLDVMSFSAGVVLLVLVAIGASLLPAWRASRVDPIIAIQGE